MALLAVTACYRPNIANDNCGLSCATSADCPGDLMCNGVSCSINGGPCVDPPTPDADLGDGGMFCAGDPLGLLGTVCFASRPAVVVEAGA